MNYVKVKSNWEEVFIHEALELEEKMSTFDLNALNKSRLRIALENKILDWSKYQAWASLEINCASLRSNLEMSSQTELTKRAAVTLEAFLHHDIWNEDLIPLETWDDSLIVIGLEHNDRLNEIPKTIFILAHPELLETIALQIFKTNSADQSGVALSESSEAGQSSLLDGIDIHISPPQIKFDSSLLKKDLVSNEKTAPLTSVVASMNTLWDYLSERHDEYSFEVKKQFNAYLVLQINNKKTQIFKMDSELEKEKINPHVFEYSLDEDNPFKKVYDSGFSESFNLNQLGITLQDFKYLCITPLKRGEITIGFLVGLKSNNLGESDQNLLEDLAKESVA